MSDRQICFNVNKVRPSSLKIERKNSERKTVSYRNFAYLASTDSSEPKEPDPDSAIKECDFLKGKHEHDF